MYLLDSSYGEADMEHDPVEVLVDETVDKIELETAAEMEISAADIVGHQDARIALDSDQAE